MTVFGLTTKQGGYVRITSLYNYYIIVIIVGKWLWSKSAWAENEVNETSWNGCETKPWVYNHQKAESCVVLLYRWLALPVHKASCVLNWIVVLILGLGIVK